MALQAYEDTLCPGCGQPLRHSLDPDLLTEWTHMDPIRCGACTALGDAAEANKEVKHPGALRYVLGLAQGWQERKAARLAARVESAATQEQ